MSFVFMCLKQISHNIYKIPKGNGRNVDIYIYIKKELLPFIEDDAIKQLAEASSLPGVAVKVLAMPDLHTGFGLPIGGVMAMDNKNGLVSAGAVGMDINCGVRLLRVNLGKEELSPSTLKLLLKAIKKRVPLGIGKKSKHSESLDKNFVNFIEKGLPAIIDLGFGRDEDPQYVEDRGFSPGANASNLSNKAFERGNQLSTIGGGNHFIEIGYVEAILNKELSSLYGLQHNQITVLIHTGSRGLGHQICTDYTNLFNKKASSYGIQLPSKGLAAVPIDSPEGNNYLSAMACAANFAYCNRQLITHDVRKAFTEVFGKHDTSLGLEIVYDIAHNIAKFEEIDGRRLLIHRKGAVRALPPEHLGNPKVYRKYGHPVIIPGSMGDSSYVVTATSKIKDTLYSANHGAGRLLSRRAARQKITPDMFRERMQGVLFSEEPNHFLDESPHAYKNIDHVVDSLVEESFITKVAKLKPLAVLKGKDVD